MPKRENVACILKKPFEREKILRIMKVTTLSLLVLSLHLTMFANGQEKITVVARNTVWAKALSAVEKASDYRFVYSSDIAPVNKKIDLVVRDADLPEVMDRLLSSTILSYKVMTDNVVVIFSKIDVAPEITVKGRITDENGAPLSGASIRVKGSSQGVSANANGEFTITVPDDAVLIFSYVGYEERQVSVSGQSTINVALQPSAKVQDQVVVVGYGSQRKRDVTGAYSSVRGSELARQPVQTPTQALQGKVAGVQVISSGEPNSLPSVRLRGTGSVLAGVNPLYVVDGVLTDDIRNINNADILTFDVLKDASATAIYGVRGANGVIIITTKKGRPGKNVFTYDGNIGIKEATDLVDMAGEQQYAGYLNEANQYYGSGTILVPVSSLKGDNRSE